MMVGVSMIEVILAMEALGLRIKWYEARGYAVPDLLKNGWQSFRTEFERRRAMKPPETDPPGRHYLTVGELREALTAVDGDLEIVVRAEDDETDVSVCGGIWAVGTDYAHDGDDTPYLALEVGNSEDPS